ncbi:MAG: hypothetical protein ABI581_09180 [Sediminibacterium sp.]
MNIKKIFKIDQTTGVSKFRFYLLRSYFALNFIALGFDAWGEIFTHTGAWQAIPGVAYSFWAAFSLLSFLGIIHPLRMLPLLLVQFTYKVIWSVIVAYPLWSSNQLPASHELASIMVKGAVLDLFIIPWPYILRNYILIPKKKHIPAQEASGEK